VRIILVGPPGVGKGTQAALLEERIGAKQLSSGNIFREELAADTELGKLAKTYMEKGELVPDEVTIGMMGKHLKAVEEAGTGFILDGFPRTVAQAQALDKLLKELGIRLDKVVSLELGDDQVVERLSARIGCSQCGEIYNKRNKPPKVENVCDKCGAELFVRKDDQPETIRERLRVFHQTTKPVVDYYESTGRLQHVDGAELEPAYREIASGLV
jgi:adenylate kinase